MSQPAHVTPRPLVVRPATVTNHVDTCWFAARLRPFWEVTRNAHPELTVDVDDGAA
jgi:hypothetical protein